ncbi:hypothetical protein [Streptomyces sp. NPDC091215]|uniref:hypothetical protein n=1 Tax=Streptomyces sp. NPDC091215 TaxID=3155192 RepID=UPI003432AC58
MKIVKKVGERLPTWLGAEIRPVLAFTGAGRALAVGSLVLARRGWDALGEHLHGWERIGALGFGGYVTVYCCEQAPHVAEFAVPGAVVVWCVTAWWVAPAATPEPAPSGEASASPDAFVSWLLQLMGDRSGIHLRELYPAMRQLPGHEGRNNAELRAALNTLGVPVERTLRLGGVAGRSGVARAALEALPCRPGELRGDPDGDAGQAVDSPGGEPVGERLESA